MSVKLPSCPYLAASRNLCKILEIQKEYGTSTIGITIRKLINSHTVKDILLCEAKLRTYKNDSYDFVIGTCCEKKAYLMRVSINFTHMLSSWQTHQVICVRSEL